MSAQSYLNRALRIIQKHALNSDLVNWPELREQCFRMARGAKSNTETYEAIRHAIQSLGDGHSFLLVPKFQSEEVEGSPPSAVPVSRPSIASFYFEEFHVAAIKVPSFSSILQPNRLELETQFSAEMQQTIAQQLLRRPKGWIVDLRGNMGGNMWPMLCGLGPLMGQEVVGYFKASKHCLAWFYFLGRAGLRSMDGTETVKVEIQHPVLHQITESVPVAVLIDQTTASSGEAIGIAFRSRLNTRFFGQQSRGLCTGNGPVELSDGVQLILTKTVFLDRQGSSYPNGIFPDVFVEPTDANPTDGDRTVDAALSWFKRHHV